MSDGRVDAPTTPVAVLPLGSFVGGSRLVRVADRLRALVAVKATFAVAPEHRAWSVAPEPSEGEALIADADLQPSPGGASFVLADSGGGEPRGRASRFAAFREGLALFDRQFADGFGQASQRVGEVRGDEWIIFEGAHPVIPRARFQLPVARAEARVAHVDRPGVIEPLELVASTVRVDARRLRIWIVWHGQITVESEEEARRLRVYAGVRTAESPIVWPAPPPREAPAPDDDPLGGATTEIDPHEARPALPFSPAAAGASAPAFVARPVDGDRADPLGETAELAVDPLKVTLPFGRSVPPGLNADLAPPAIERPASIAAGDPEPPPPPPPPVAARPANPLLDALAGRLERGESLDGLALAGADLSGMRLAGAKLDGVDLGGTNLSGADLTEARLVGAKLVSADLGGANLAGANLSGADLTGCGLEDTKLDGARFAQATGERARFARAVGERVDFARARWDEGDFHEAVLPGADFTGASMRGARFDGARLEAARLVDAAAEGASFAGAKLGHAKANGGAFGRASFRLVEAISSQWDDASFDEASFEGACLDRATFVRSRGERASFRDVSLRRANLQRSAFATVDGLRADLGGADLRQAKWPGAVLDDCNLAEANLGRADLRGASLGGANLSAATLAEAKLGGAVLARVRLDRADLRDADLENVDLRGASVHEARLQGAKSDGLVADPGLVGAAPPRSLEPS